MEIIIKNPEDGKRMAESVSNRLIADVLYQAIVREEGQDKLKNYLQLIKYLEEFKYDN